MRSNHAVDYGPLQVQTCVKPDGGQYTSVDDARLDLFEYIEVISNRKRRHSSNRYLSPVDYERLVLSGAAVAA